METHFVWQIGVYAWVLKNFLQDLAVSRYGRFCKSCALVLAKEMVLLEGNKRWTNALTHSRSTSLVA